MDELRALYQEVIFDHNKSPRNFGKLDDADRAADGHNPLCGDQLTVYLDMDADGETIADVRFEGQGCAISTASASIMTTLLKGRSIQDVEKYFSSFHSMVTGSGEPDSSLEDFDKLKVLGGVSEYPSRVKCATLAWHTVKAALAGEKSISTE